MNALDGLPVGFGTFLAPAVFHALGKMLPSCRAVFGNTPLAQEPVHSQPADPLARRFEVLPVTAPEVLTNSSELK